MATNLFLTVYYQQMGWGIAFYMVEPGGLGIGDCGDLTITAEYFGFHKSLN